MKTIDHLLEHLYTYAIHRGEIDLSITDKTKEKRAKLILATFRFAKQTTAKDIMKKMPALGASASWLTTTPTKVHSHIRAVRFGYGFGQQGAL